MTDLDIIKNVILSLDRINVPTMYIEQIAVPLVEANNQLKALYNHYVKKVQEAKANEEAETKPEDKVSEEVPSEEHAEE